MERGSTPSLLPILRSQQQGELLAHLLGDPELEVSLTDLAGHLGVPVSSVYREIERAQSAGLVTSHKIGNTRLVRADTNSPYYHGLADVLVKAFGPPHVLADALSGIANIDAAYIYGSWAARSAGDAGERPIGDLDVLVLGSPDRDNLYAAASAAEKKLGRPIQVTIRAANWLDTGTGNFHATVAQRPLVRIQLTSDQTATDARSR
jgi:DNA-binding transcriptional ArsR family regulator